MKKFYRFLLGVSGLLISLLVGKHFIKAFRKPDRLKSSEQFQSSVVNERRGEIYQRFSERNDKVSTKFVVGGILLCVFLIGFFVVIPLLNLRAGCPYRSGARFREDCTYAFEAYTIFFIIGASITGKFIWNRMKQGLWGKKPQPENNPTGRRINTTSNRYIGRAIIGFLFLISPLLGTTVIYSLMGFLAGGACIFFLRLATDLALVIKGFIKA